MRLFSFVTVLRLLEKEVSMFNFKINLYEENLYID